MSLLQKAKARQRALNISGELFLSNRPDKKLMLIHDNKRIHFGLKGSQTYLEGASIEKRKAYRARHMAIMTKNGTPAYEVEYSSSWLSYHILW